jgi:predicted  nucleic acid-binding Zn-ribbon protein
MFSFVDSVGYIHTIMIGATGSYEINLEEPIYKLKILTSNNLLPNNV